jgi:hypothetical protein
VVIEESRALKKRCLLKIWSSNQLFDSPNMDDRQTDITPAKRSPDFELALAFFGSIGVGIVSSYVGFFLAGLSIQHVSSLVLGSITGIPWGFLAVIVAACVEPLDRRNATLKMFTILGVAMIVLTYVVGYFSQFV